MFVVLNNQKIYFIMKKISTIMIVALLFAGLFTSCTPESIQDEQTPQQIDPWTVTPPRQG